MKARAHSEDPDWPAVLRTRRATFDALVRVAEVRLAHGRLAHSALAAQAAAEYAWRCHFGAFAEPRLETVLEAIAGTLDPAPEYRPQGASVLHVITRALSVGGHTHLMCGWIDRDPHRTHHVVSTGQAGEPMPERVAQAVASSGGALHDVSELPILERATALSALAARSRWCVVHHNPSDVVPGLAFSPGRRSAPTIVINHADHVCWVGTRMADAVAHIRPAALAMAAAHRGLDSRTGVVVPIPLDPVSAGPTREGARLRLGVSEDEVLLTSVATEYKFGGEAGAHFLDGLEDVFVRNPRLRLIAVGPAPTGRWKEAEQATQGRIRAVGPQPDVGVFLAAADAYVDSLFTSFTSLLEAAQSGLPVIARRPTYPELTYLTMDNPAVACRFTWVDDEKEAAEIIEGWSPDARARAANHAAMAELIAREYSGEAWLAAMNRAYAVAENTASSDVRREAGPDVTPIADRLAIYVATVLHRGALDGAFVSAILLAAEGSGRLSKALGVVRLLWATRHDRVMWKSWLRRRALKEVAGIRLRTRN